MRNDRLITLIATCGGIGYLPLVPGTWASAVVAVVYLVWGPSLTATAAGAALAIVLGSVVAGRAERVLGIPDPSCVVIDEVAGMLLALCAVPATNTGVGLAFVLFRVCDVFKFEPARSFEKRHGSLGIMGDDIVAGIYAGLTVHLIYWLKHLSGALCRGV